MRIFRDISYWFMDLSNEVEENHPLNGKFDRMDAQIGRLQDKIERLERQNSYVLNELNKLHDLCSRQQTDMNTLMKRFVR